jgi:type II secretory pathway pseudopilin PulG
VVTPAMSWRKIRRSIRSTHRPRGYVLLTLLLTFSLLAIAAAVIAPSIAFQIKRDREEELLHRGVQYARGIRMYATKTGHYPIVIQELSNREGGNKYIRQIYKDPITGRDFRFLHTDDITSAAPHVDLNNSQSQTNGSENVTGSDPNAGAAANSQDAGNAGKTGVGTGSGNSSDTDSADNSHGQLIFGVASNSKKRTIREFDHKNHYNQWLFFYDQNHGSGHQMLAPTSLSPSTPSLQGQSTVSPTQPSGGQSPTTQPAPSPQ